MIRSLLPVAGLISEPAVLSVRAPRVLPAAALHRTLRSSLPTTRQALPSLRDSSLPDCFPETKKSAGVPQASPHNRNACGRVPPSLSSHGFCLWQSCSSFDLPACRRCLRPAATRNTAQTTPAPARISTVPPAPAALPGHASTSPRRRSESHHPLRSP